MKYILLSALVLCLGACTVEPAGVVAAPEPVYVNPGVVVGPPAVVVDPCCVGGWGGGHRGPERRWHR